MPSRGFSTSAKQEASAIEIKEKSSIFTLKQPTEWQER